MRFVLPRPGDGPSENSIETGFVKGIIIARLENGITAEAKLKCPGDPGNKATIKFLGSIMKVLLNEDSLKCGFLTPSTACEEFIFSYFKEEGIEFSEFCKIN